MPKRKFLLRLTALENTGEGVSMTSRIEFDPCDIYDGALAPIIRGMARTMLDLDLDNPGGPRSKNPD